jgi:hypothetical protein
VRVEVPDKVGIRFVLTNMRGGGPTERTGINDNIMESILI